MLKRIPFLAIAIMLFTVFFISIVFIYTSPLEDFKADAAENTGRVLGVSEAEESFRLDELYDADNFFPPSGNAEDSPVVPERREGSGDDIIPEAQSAAIMDVASGAVIFGHDADRRAPIASITKLMTALVFLEFNPGWDSAHMIGPEDNVGEGRVYLNYGEKVSLRDLFYLSLVGSDNNAAMALVNATGLGPDDFVAKMNERAAALGLAGTGFVDPVGLSGYNISTAAEVTRLTAAALAIEEIRDATMTKKYEFSTLGGRKVAVANTDILLEIFPQNGILIMGGKTGYTESAGYCFTGKFTDAGGHETVSAVLGTATPNLRFRETRKLVEWIYNNYSWQER